MKYFSETFHEPFWKTESLQLSDIFVQGWSQMTTNSSFIERTGDSFNSTFLNYHNNAEQIPNCNYNQIKKCAKKETLKDELYEVF